MRTTTLTMLGLLTALSTAQTSPGGGGTPTSPPSAGPSWALYSKVATGMTTGKNYYYDNQNVVESETWTLDWATGVWSSSRTGASNAAPFLPFTNQTTESRTVTSSSSGTVTIRLKYTGAGAPPEHVYFVAASDAQAVYSMTSNASGSGSVNNGLGSPASVDQSNPLWDKTSTPKKQLKLLKTFSENGFWFVELAVSKSASASAGGPGAQAAADAYAFSLTADPRVLELTLANTLSNYHSVAGVDQTLTRPSFANPGSPLT